MAVITFSVLVVILSTAALVWAVRSAPAAVRPFKLLASSGFIAVALATGALSSSYGKIVLVALSLSWLGDLLLTFDSRRGFIGGLISFLLGHVAYSVAFGTLGLDPAVSAVTAAVVVVIGVIVWRWLSPHVADMRSPVIAYIVIISTMIALAFGTFAHGSTWLIPVGASFFYVSDLFVARNQFVAPGIMNRVWGLPLYYTAQVLLALSVASEV